MDSAHDGEQAPAAVSPHPEQVTPGGSDDETPPWYSAALQQLHELDGQTSDEDEEEYENDDDEDDEFHDAEAGNVEFEVGIDDDDGEGEDDEDDEVDEDDEDEYEYVGGDEVAEEDDEVEQAAGNAQGVTGGLATILGADGRSRTGLLTRAQLMALLRNRDFSNILLGDDDQDLFLQWGRRRRRRNTDPNRFPKVPSEEGVKLMRSGVFGANDSSRRPRKYLARKILERELGLGDRGQRKRNQDLIVQDLVPSTRAEHIVHYDDPIYSGQFSDDGNFFFSCSQDFNVRMYDTSNPYNWKHYKTANYPWGYWTLTDASLSPDNRWLAYTSIQSKVSIAPTDPLDTGDPYTLDLEGNQGETRFQGHRARGFGIWSIRFSGDGRELVAGTSSDAIVVYDIESRTVLHHIEGHEDDVNAVCFADKSSPHILYSGSDDATIKIWDRRSMGDGREAGAFVGHIEGLTYIDSKGDGRYILSNGKDQSMKLWDLRMVMSTDRFRQVGSSRHSRLSGFDYRRETYDDEDWHVHPHDNSVVTFRGHKVLRTLIRCHFAPASATNSRYVYSGSADGKVYVWNMDATLAEVIDVKKATIGTRPQDRRTRFYFDEAGGWETCVRDASWHPSAPLLVASAWNGYSMARGTCTLHSFNQTNDDEGEPKMGRSVDNMLRTTENLYDRPDFT